MDVFDQDEKNIKSIHFVDDFLNIKYYNRPKTMIPSRMSSYPPDKSSSFRFLKNPSNNTSSPYSVYYDISEEFKGIKIRQNKHLVGQKDGHTYDIYSDNIKTASTFPIGTVDLYYEVIKKIEQGETIEEIEINERNKYYQIN